MNIKILKNCFHAAFVIIIVLCFCVNALGAPIVYSDTSIHEYVDVYGYGTDGDWQQEHIVGPGTATKIISEVGYYYVEANAIGDVGSFVLHGDCKEFTTESVSADAMSYVVEKYTFTAPSSEVIFTYDISLTELYDESSTSRESQALMSWYIMETGGTSLLASEQYNIYMPEDITRAFTLTLTEGAEYFLHLSPHLYLSTTYTGENTPDENWIAGRFEGSFTLETAENNQQVPEPSSLLFLAFGIAGLVGIRKKF